jgi:hypothetical protein
VRQRPVVRWGSASRKGFAASSSLRSTDLPERPRAGPGDDLCQRSRTQASAGGQSRRVARRGSRSKAFCGSGARRRGFIERTRAAHRLDTDRP